MQDQNSSPSPTPADAPVADAAVELPLVVGSDGHLSPRGVAHSVVRHRARYSPELGEIISDLHVEKSLTAISKIDGMPAYGVIMRWMRDNPEFRDKIDQARAARALHFEEQAMLAVGEPDDPIPKDDVAGQRLKFDAYSWAAGINDPARYGKKTTIQGDASKPIVFKVVTGVPEPSAPALELGADGLVKEVVSQAEDAPAGTSSPEPVESTLAPTAADAGSEASHGP